MFFADLIADCVEYLEIQKPFTIELKSKSKETANAKYWGLHTESGKLSRHLIRVFLGNLDGNQRDLETLIAHEFVHAWQEENGHTDIHGVSFQETAIEMEWFLRDRGYDVSKIYDPEIDIDEDLTL